MICIYNKNPDAPDGKGARMQALLANYTGSEMRSKMELEASRPGTSPPYTLHLKSMSLKYEPASEHSTLRSKC